MSQLKNINVAQYFLPGMVTYGAFFRSEGNNVQLASLPPKP